MFVMIDNYDSFTYNLVHLVSTQGVPVRVFRNDKITVRELEDLQPEGLILSPGPKRPEDAGICMEAIRAFAGKIPILGVCLGHQAIAAAFGGRVVRAEKLFHGKGSQVHHDRRRIFFQVRQPFFAMRYHSLLVDRDALPDCLEISAETEAGEIMGVRHKDLAVEGLQFHPESIMAEEGVKLIRNFLFDRQRNFIPAEAPGGALQPSAPGEGF